MTRCGEFDAYVYANVPTVIITSMLMNGLFGIHSGEYYDKLNSLLNPETYEITRDDLKNVCEDIKDTGNDIKDWWNATDDDEDKDWYDPRTWL